MPRCVPSITYAGSACLLIAWVSQALSRLDRGAGGIEPPKTGAGLLSKTPKAPEGAVFLLQGFLVKKPSLVLVDGENHSR